MGKTREIEKEEEICPKSCLRCFYCGCKVEGHDQITWCNLHDCPCPADLEPCEDFLDELVIEGEWERENTPPYVGWDETVEDWDEEW